ncbi:MAG: HD domain-containing protein [Clostridia bacterium]|nr:HD domain-containing protein [Clostridia bacterium]
MHEDLKKIIACSENYFEIITEYNSRAKKIYKNERQLSKLFIYSIEKILAKKSYETDVHSKHMTSLAKRLGVILNLATSEIKTLSLIAKFHDIGKINISSSILNKPDKLNVEEWKEIKLHSKHSFDIVNSVEEYKYIANDILHHHEHFDGTGYPDGLTGKDIPLFSRIIAVLDTYDVLVSGRIYKPAVSKIEAIQEIKRCSGTQFDPSIVKIFLEVCAKSGIIPKAEQTLELM